MFSKSESKVVWKVTLLFGAIKSVIHAVWPAAHAEALSFHLLIFKWFNFASDCQVLKYEPSHL